jgi:membrane protease YdiL (CAAX protease family)
LPERPLDRFADARPDLVLMSPYLLYLALLALRDIWPEYNAVAAAIRGVLPMVLVWLFRRHIRWGSPDWHIALLAGALVAFGWFYGQYAMNALGVPQRLPLPMLFPGQADSPPFDPRERLGEGLLFWITALTHIAVASTTVGFVEELFWRAFLLRALIDWQGFERIPLGTFTWVSFLGTSLLSTVQHPDHWLVSILCWMAFNGLMYWRRSILCLVITHCFTNLVLYAWVLYAAMALGDVHAWMHLSLAAKP